MALARKEAERRVRPSADTEHLLMAMLRVEQGVGISALVKLGIAPELLRARLEEKTPSAGRPKLGNKAKVAFAPRFKRVLVLAEREAKSMGHSNIGTDHLLLGLLRETNGVAADVLSDFKPDLEAARAEVLRGLDDRKDPIEDISKKLNAVLDVLGRLKLEVTELRLALPKENA
jgi:ATP-dependent Clp protease ATP-binding subunit ClpC